ncbi:MAG: Ig-like domain-containing protein [Erysipelotrichaceae bacterium]|nr:Ig-like domain-containing protein [Erysipelotrichaceae bacterium]
MKKIFAILLSCLLSLSMMTSIHAASVKISATSATIKVGKTKTLSLKNTKKKVTWSSTNKKIAKVSTKGKVTAVKVGTCTIKAKVSGSSKVYQCKVTVTAWLSATSATLKSGATKTLTLNGTTIKSYSSTDKDVVKVSKSSSTKVKLTAVNHGTAKVKIVGNNGQTLTCNVTTNAYISKTKLTLTPGGSQTVTLKGTEIASVKSSKTSVATVSSSGKIKAVAGGSATITYTGTNDLTYTCKVTVSAPKLSHTKVSMPVGLTMNLFVFKTSETPTYSTSNKAIVKVSKAGKITAVSCGSATITATLSTCELTCKVNVTGYLNVDHVSLDIGDTYKLVLTGTSIESVSSSNKSIAKISSSGKITAVSEGHTTVKITDSNGDTYTCDVVVVDDANTPATTLTVGIVGDARDLLKVSSGTFKTSNEAIALVDSKYGIIVPVSAGTCKITNGNKSVKITVVDNDNVKVGVDVSKWQSTINVSKLKSNNLDFVILRAGHGVEKDPKFASFVKQLYEGKMTFGIYWYMESHSSSRDMNKADATAEAETLVAILNQYKDNDGFNDYFNMPVYLDLEDASLYSKTYKSASKADRAAHMQEICEAFTAVLEENGYTNYSFYANKSFTESYLSNDYFASFAAKYWHARYGFSGVPTVTINGQTIAPDIWQVGSQFAVAGTGSTYTDVDYWYN